MIFNTSKDIESDIKNKLSQYIKDNCENLDFKLLRSIIWVYLRELNIIHELDSYFVSEIVDNNFYIKYTKDNNEYSFNISSIIEIRKIKIEKIKSNKVIKTYFI